MEQLIQKYVPVRDGHLAVDVYGEPDGSAIVIIPGAMADAAAWAPVAREVSAWPTVVVVNRRGRHPSARLTADYSLDLEIEDALAVIGYFSDVRTTFGWSFGALIALHAADVLPVPHTIGYEPIMAPFGRHALEALERAHRDGDREASTEIALREVAGMSPDVIATLRSQTLPWNGLQHLSAPLHAETHAINDTRRPAARAALAGRVDLIIGEQNRGRAPYGTTFQDVARHLPAAIVHRLPGQGHLAHLEAPAELAALVDAIDRDRE